MSDHPASSGSSPPSKSPRRPASIAEDGPSPDHAATNLLAHELKGISGRLGLVLQSLELEGRFDDRRFRRRVRDVLGATVTQLRRLANELEDRRGRLLVGSSVDLNATVGEALEAIRPAANEGVEFVQSYADIPPIRGDAFLLRSAVSRAIENALEAMGGRGTLRISTTRSHRQERRRVTLEIADDGPGMSEEFVRRQLFEPFVTTKPDGMGMGAYTFRQIAALHGGTVRVVSREGGGTRVRFHLPVEPE